MADYIPRSNSDALLWFSAFKNGTSQNPERYMLSRPDAETIASAVDDYAAAYAAANNPATRTATSISRTRAARSSAEGICRTFAGLIKRNNGISDEAKLAIGVPPVNNAKSRIECPRTSPALTIVASTPGGQTVEYRDSVSTSRRARPHGATGLQLFVAIADENASNPADARFVGTFTSTPMPVIFNPADRGKQATYFARWSGRRNQVGQWSLPVSMTIAA